MTTYNNNFITSFVSDILPKEFLERYIGKNPKWGFDGMGYITYKRTYARLLPDGKTTEEWWQTVARCINGAQKIGAKYTPDEAQELFDLIFHLKCSFAGRMLWQLGTSTVDRFGSSSLLNCWFVTMKRVEDFCFLFENLMLGGGVGFSVKREDVHELPKVKKNVKIVHEKRNDTDFIVPDSREGWVKLLKNVLTSFFHTGESFTYSTILVRGKGEKISGFGGTASGPAILIQGIEQICDVLKSREGKKLRSVDVLDICNIIGSVVVAGNVRRSAEIAIGDPDDFLFLRAKRWDLGNTPNWRVMSNNTIGADSYEQISDSVWEGYNGNGEPYGFFNLPLSQKYGRLGEERKDSCEGLNPCFSGDTQIAVADGRNSISIRELAEIGNDVPVYSINSITGKVSIKMGRNPRVTGREKEIVRVMLDNGSYFDVTPDHKIPLLNGEVKRAIDLQKNDSLFHFRKAPEKISQKNRKQYFRIHTDSIDMKNKRLYEHKLISQFFEAEKWKSRYDEEQKNGWINGGLVVHHKNYDSLDNRPENLEVMTFSEHCVHHASKDTQGERNGNYSGFSNSDLEKAALDLTTTLGRRFSRKEWIEFSKKTGVPRGFSKWRRNGWFATVLELSKWAAIECGFESIADVDPRVVKTYQKAIQQGYDAKIENGVCLVKRYDEYDGSEFWVSYHERERAYASGRNSLAHRNMLDSLTNEKRKANLRNHFENDSIRKKKQQLDIYFELRERNGRVFKKEWEQKCREQNVPIRFGAKTMFSGYKELVNVAETYNHKVVSVELLKEKQTVYNITVDDNHTVGIITSTKNNKYGNKIYDGVYLLNCGEIVLSNYECCNLSELFLNNISSEEELIRCAVLLYKTQKAISSGNFLYKETNDIVHKNMRLGLGVTGICQAGEEKLSWLNHCYKELRKFDKMWSKENGWSQSIKLTTVKPSGTLSILAGSTPGIHPGFSEYHIRRVRVASNANNIINVCKEIGYPIEYARKLDGTNDYNTMVISFPCNMNSDTIFAKNMKAVDQLELVRKLQTIWADNAVSNTVYYKKEELPEIKEWMKNNYEHSIKSTSFLLHSDHGFDQAPYEEITEEKYLSLKKGLKSIDDIFERDFSGGDMESLELCAGGVCPVK